MHFNFNLLICVHLRQEAAKEAKCFVPDEGLLTQALLTSAGFTHPPALARKLCLIIRLLENLVRVSALTCSESAWRVCVFSTVKATRPSLLLSCLCLELN